MQKEKTIDCYGVGIGEDPPLDMPVRVKILMKRSHLVVPDISVTPIDCPHYDTGKCTILKAVLVGAKLYCNKDFHYPSHVRIGLQYPFLGPLDDVINSLISEIMKREGRTT